MATRWNPRILIYIVRNYVIPGDHYGSPNITGLPTESHFVTWTLRDFEADYINNEPGSRSLTFHGRCLLDLHPVKNNGFTKNPPKFKRKTSSEPSTSMTLEVSKCVHSFSGVCTEPVVIFLFPNKYCICLSSPTLLALSFPSLVVFFGLLSDSPYVGEKLQQPGWGQFPGNTQTTHRWRVSKNTWENTRLESFGWNKNCPNHVILEKKHRTLYLRIGGLWSPLPNGRCVAYKMGVALTTYKSWHDPLQVIYHFYFLYLPFLQGHLI